MSEIQAGSLISHRMSLTKVCGFRCSGPKMKTFHLREIFLYVLLYFSCGADGLKCRTVTESQQSNDFEYVVRMCLRHLKNESDMYDFYKIQTDFDSAQNRRQNRDEISGDNNNNNNNNNNNDNRNYYSRNRGYPEGFDRFWPPSGAPLNRNRYNDDDDRNGQKTDYDEPDYFGLPRNGKDGRKKFRGKSQTPHSYQQQLQHDRDVHGQGNRDSSYFYSNRNKNTKLMFNREKKSDSPLADIDPCVIHCIFQEMQMVDNNGKPNKGLISQKMTQKIRNSELKNFIQESIDECFDAVDDEDDFTRTTYLGNYKYNNKNNNNRYRKLEMVCDWAKTFALCLEERGRENCDDWNEPIQKNRNNNNNNSNNSSNKNGSNTNNEDQRHKSKQNDRG